VTRDPGTSRYVAGVVLSAAVPLLIVLAMTWSRELEWRPGLAAHLALGVVLGALTSGRELAWLRRSGVAGVARAERLAGFLWIAIIVGGTLAARKWFGPSELFSWLLGWGCTRCALLWRTAKELPGVEW
jgi:hypothetical protein